MLDIRFKAILPAVYLVLMIVVISPVFAATWSVERDGSGDFSIIQLAVDVAASGDTIRVGPGRYDEKQLVTCPGWSDSVRVLVSQEELTIVGSGTETIIGQADPWDIEQGYHKGIVASDFWGNSAIRIENLHMENMRTALYTSYTTPCIVEVRNCSFYGNNNSITLNSEGGVAQIVDSEFNHMQRNGAHVSGWSQTEFVMRRCTLRLWDVHQWPQQHLYLDGVQNALIEDCDFLEGSIAAVLSSGGSSFFKDCLFDGQSNICVGPSILTNVTVDRSIFRNGNIVFSSQTSDNQLVVQNSVIESVADCSFMISYTGTVSVHDCDLAKGERGVVWVSDINNCGTVQTLDMTNNYWGTDDPDSIQAWIRDNNDSEDACFIIDYEPYLDESTPVESKSISNLKSLFR